MQHTSKTSKLIWSFGVLAVILVALAISTPVFATTDTLTITADTTLSEDHTGNIVIAADGVTLDCDGRTVTDTGSGVGIFLDGRTGVTVENCDVTGFAIAIFLKDSSGNTLEENTVNNSGSHGFAISVSSNNNTLEENTADGNGGFGIRDASTGSGTASTANTHDENECEDNTLGDSSPTGLCDG